MCSHPIDDGLVWTDVTDVLKNDTAIREIAAVQQPEGMDYVSTPFLAHLAYGHCDDAAMRLIAKASELYGGAFYSGQGVDLRVDCEGCQLAGNIKRNQKLHQGRLVGQATAPGESLHEDVAGPIVPMRIGHAMYVLVAVDELTRYAWVLPMWKKSQTARLLALLIQQINTQVRRPGEHGVRRLHSDQGGEFKSYSLEEFCHLKGVDHTFTDRAQHESNRLVERKISQLNESTRAALLASDLPAYVWPEVYMAMCPTQNIVPSSALQRELKNKEQQKKEEKSSGERNSSPGETGEETAPAEPVEPPVRNMIPYLVFYCDVTDEQFQHLISQLKPWGVPVLVYHRRDNMRHLETRGQKGFYVGPGSGLSMYKVFLGKGGSRAVKQFTMFSYHQHMHNSMTCAHTCAISMSHLSSMTELRPR